MTAIRQRTRWIMGITLQSWEYHTLGDTLRHFYWFWRDRKGVIGNLLTPVANVLFVAGLCTWAGARAHHQEWLLAREMGNYAALYGIGLAIQLLQTSIRIGCSAAIYGWKFAACVPVRVLVANAINCAATARAITTYVNCKLHGRPLRWVKTEHAYPNRAALMRERKSLRDILVGSQWITPKDLDAALASKPPDRRLGEHLLMLRLITEQDLYAALSLQNDLPMGKPEPGTISVPVTRSLPADLAKRLRVLPFRIVGGELYVAGSEVPDERMHSDIRNFTSLEIRFQLVTPTEFAELEEMYLG